MTNQRLTIWCNNDFTGGQKPERELLIDGTAAHRLLIFDACDVEARTALKTAEIAFGAPDPQAVCESANLRWVHLNTAGYTSFDHQDIREKLAQRGVIVTNSSDVYAEPCAQHRWR